MRFRLWLGLLLAALGSTACVTSILPLFEDECLIELDGLEGDWTADDSADLWTFEKSGGREYMLVHRQAEFDRSRGYGLGGRPDIGPGDTVRFRARLGRLAGTLFLDLSPAESGNPQVRNDWYNAHFVPAHTIARIHLDGDSLRLIFMHQDWIRKALESGRIGLPHLVSEGSLVLTAATADLQAFLATHARDGEAFPPGAAIELVRSGRD